MNFYEDGVDSYLKTRQKANSNKHNSDQYLNKVKASRRYKYKYNGVVMIC